MRENGRSMVEMLGVLAIIGVLSVGAISGYSKAMMKYKLNKQTEQINYLMSSALAYGTGFGHTFSSTGSYTSVSLIPILKKLNVIPKEMYIENNDRNIKDALNNLISIDSAHEPDFSYRYYIMIFNLDASNITIESCRNIATLMKAYSAEINQFIGGYSENGSGNNRYRYWGDSNCNQSKSKNCLRDISLIQIDDMCRSCNEENCNFAVQWGTAYD